MKKSLVSALAVTLFGLTGGLQAQEPAADVSNNTQAIQALAELGPGVHKIQKDDAGRLKSCVIVGQARISTVLGTAKGLELARTRAKLNANAEFVRWMKSTVKAVESMTNESIVYLEGSGAGLSESGKATEVTKDNVEVLAEGVIRGMTLIGAHQDGANGLLTEVYGWTPRHAGMAGEAQSANVNPPTPRVTAPVPQTPSPGQENAPLPTKTVVSDEADSFLKSNQ